MRELTLINIKVNNLYHPERNDNVIYRRLYNISLFDYYNQVAVVLRDILEIAKVKHHILLALTKMTKF